MEDNYKSLVDFYDSMPEKEWNRMNGNYSNIEFYIVQKKMSLYVKRGMRVLDLGCGPGKHSIELAKKGCYVTLVDISKKSLEFAVEEFKKLHLENMILDVVCTSAEKFENELNIKYDAVLAFGPFYHIIEEEKRQECLRNIENCLKDNGYLFSIFISKISLMKDCLKRGWINCLNKQVNAGYLETGIYIPENDNILLQYMPAFKAFDYEEAMNFIKGANISVIDYSTCESFAAFMRPYIQKIDYSEKEYTKLLELLEKLSNQNCLINSSDHFLIIGKYEG